jgi:acetyl esterase/lipase
VYYVAVINLLRLLALASLGGCLLAAQTSASSEIAAPAPVMLWPNGAPGALGAAPRDRPRLYPFLPATPSTQAAVLVIPGGGYSIVALDLEGFQFARWLNAQGIPAFVLDYRVAPYRYPAEIQDGLQAVRLIRSHAAEYKIDPDRLGVWGSSAGGHLASTLGTHCVDGAPPLPRLSTGGCRLSFMILTYPVVTMELPLTHRGSRDNLLGPDPGSALVAALSNESAVTAHTPATFIMATSGDPVVPIENSVKLYRAMVEAHVPAELHLYDFARHGTGLAGTTFPYLASWTGLLRHWLTHIGVLPAAAPPPPAAAANDPAFPAGFSGPGLPTAAPGGR